MRMDFSEDFYRIGGKYYLLGDKLTLNEIGESDYSKALNQKNMDEAICKINQNELELYKNDPAGYKEAMKYLDTLPPYWVGEGTEMPAGKEFLKAHYIKLEKLLNFKHADKNYPNNFKIRGKLEYAQINF